MDVELANLENGAKKDVERSRASVNGSYRKSRRKETKRKENVCGDVNDDALEEYDEENWDEIDSTILRDYRGMDIIDRSWRCVICCIKILICDSHNFLLFSDAVLQSLDECDASSDASIFASSLIEETVIHFQNKLKENKYHGYLFDRSKAKSKLGVDENTRFFAIFF